VTLTPTEAETPATEHEQVQVLIEEARQRGRRQRLLVGILLLLVVAIGVAAVRLLVGRTEGRGARSSTAARVTVFLPSGYPIHVLGELDALSCPTSTNCWAVGVHYGPRNRAVAGQPPDEPATLIEHWSGGHWHTVPSPTLQDFAPLVAVSCPTATDCVAGGREWGDFGVGYSETWSGHRWRLISPPYYGGTPWTVSCPRLNECVGAYYDHGSNYWAELWNGRKWLLLDRPGLSQILFADASCGSPQSCWWVGQADDAGTPGAAVGWINHHWSPIHQIGPVGADRLTLDSISCIGPNFCVTTGSGSCNNSINQTCAFASAIWNGHQWRIVATSSTNTVPGGDNGMSVACQSATDCLAVWGSTLEHFNGSTWSRLTLRIPKGLPRVTLLGVTALKRGTYLVDGTTGDHYNVSGNAVIGILDGRRLALVQD
jgi:hypothetical protein